LAAAAFFASAQIGVVRGLGILEWGGGQEPTTPELRQLIAWITFIFAAAVLAGVGVGRRSVKAALTAEFVKAELIRAEATAAPAPAKATAKKVAKAATKGKAKAAGSAAPTPVPAPASLSARLAELVHLSAWARLVAAVAAGFGAAAASALIWAPLMASPPANAIGIRLALTISVAIAVVVGVALALAAMAAPAIYTGTVVGIGWIWLVALTSAGLSIAAGAEPGIRLGMLDVPQLAAVADWRLGPATMIGMSAWFAIVVATRGRWRAAPTWEVAISGSAGPLLVACAYLAAGPGRAESSAQVEAYITAVLAAAAGGLVSTTIAMVRRTAEVPTPASAAATKPTPAPAPAPAIASTPARQPQPTLPPTPPPSRQIEAPPKAPVIDSQAVITSQFDDVTRLPKRERDHIAWVEDLVRVPTSPELDAPRRK
jgi:hypothetical protein